MKTVALYGEYLKHFIHMDPFEKMSVLDLKGSFALGSTMEQDDGTDKPAGLCIVSDDNDRLIIEWICVMPEYRELGIGTNFLHLVFEEALRRGKTEVSAHISDEYDDDELAWDSDTFFVNDVFSEYEDTFPEIRFSMKDLSKLLRAEEALNKKAAEDASVISLSKIPLSDRNRIISGLNNAFSSKLPADAEALINPSDKDMSFVMEKGGEVKGALFIRKSGDTWIVYSLVAKDDEDAEKLVRAAMHYIEDYARVRDSICIKPQKKSSLKLIDKFKINYKSYGMHFITASLSDYEKQKKLVESAEI